MAIKLKTYCELLNIVEGSAPQLPVDFFKRDESKTIFSKFIAGLLFASVKGDVKKVAEELDDDPELIQLSKDIARLSNIFANKIEEKIKTQSNNN